jgi:hypothetical protein
MYASQRRRKLETQAFLGGVQFFAVVAVFVAQWRLQHLEKVPASVVIPQRNTRSPHETEVSSGTGWPMSLGEWDKRGWCPLHGHDHLEASQVRVLTEFSSPTGAQEVKGW